MTGLRLRGATVRRGGRDVLRDVDLDVRGGELLALLGPNGAGKSTALAALAGDVALAAGVSELDERPLGGWSARDLARRRAVLLQANAVAFPFSAADVVRMGRAPWQGTALESEDDEAVAAALQAMDLTALARRPVPSLSGGEQARVAIARTLAQRTGVLLLDEPTAALDLHHAERTLTRLRELAGAGAAVVVVLHDLNLAAAYADRVVLLGAGRVVGDGPPRQVLEEETVGRVYGHDVDVVTHPRSGQLLVLPRRG